MNWYPWGEEALARAKELDQPIFLSIGYAACHWCHVMERESFEDDDTAAELNARFVAIKVDREERPDLDSIYMDALQALTNQGGWPMSMFLTPDGLPFYGGTYFPDQPRHGMPAFRQVLARIAEVWEDRREWIESTATKLAERVRDEQDAPARLMAALAQLPEVASAERLDDATRGLLKSFDPVNGGWGEAPKFPQAMSIELLLREHVRTGAKEPRLVAERTLDAMAAGGIYDHLGGGFARYSTDARWLVPHFEKMLYDNALLARAYAHAAELTGDPHYAYIARETLDFVAHEMRNPAGRRLRRQPRRRYGRYGGRDLHLGRRRGPHHPGRRCATLRGRLRRDRRGQLGRAHDPQPRTHRHRAGGRARATPGRDRRIPGPGSHGAPACPRRAPPAGTR